MKVKSVLGAAAMCTAALLSTQAEAARVVVGVGIGVPFGYGYGYGYGPGYYGPGYWAPYPQQVVVVPPADPAPRMAPASPDPIFYPKNGQDAAMTESDRRACNAWAATQPAAMADAGTFQRATYACMEGRGYTVK